MISKKVRVITVGPAWYGNCVKNTYLAFLGLGIRTSIVYINSLPAPFGGNKDSITTTFEKAKTIVRQFNSGLFSFLKKTDSWLARNRFLNAPNIH